jgi:D-ribulokinase
MSAMSELGRLTGVTTPEMARFHSAKRRVHQLMRQLDLDSRAAIASDGGPLRAAGSE